MDEWTPKVTLRQRGLSLLAAGSVLAGLSCGGGDIQAPTTGSLEITTATSGPEPDADGYTVTIDDGAEAGLGTNATLHRDDLKPGSHSVRLTGMAANCTVAGENPRTISITPGEATTVTFQLTCSATTGSLQITSSTSGPSPDPDGYTISLDGTDRGTLGVSGAATLEGITPGDRVVGLSSVAANCQVEGDNPRTVTVTAGASATVAFAITCVPPPPVTGTLKVTTATSGVSPDPNGYTVALDDGAAQPIGATATLTVPAVSPGEHRVTLTGLATNCRVEGANPLTVTVAAGATATAAFGVSCSALPPMIAFGSGGDIFVVNPDGTGLTNLTHTSSEVEGGPEWSPDRSKIAFGVGSHDIYVMNADGTGRAKLATTTFDDMFGFRWSPDGNMIVFGTACCEGANQFVFTLFIMRADGSDQRLLADDALSPSWSPDGTKIAFDSPFARAIFVVNADGTGQTLLVPDAAVPEWSPDGTRIAFEAFSNERWGMETIHPDGTGRANLTSGPGLEGPVWSPDGSKIAFVANFEEVTVMNSDGSGRTSLAPGGGITWAPDGSQIAFGFEADIYVINTDGTGQFNVTNSPATPEGSEAWAFR